MGKTYIDTVKYMIKGTLKIDGIVEKPDVVGAIFGQTEGLLSDDLDLRELLKAGRIGRIEVDLKINKGKSSGTIAVPSSLDKSETALLAAVLETVDRVGPCNSEIKVTDIVDTRSTKREFVMGRAKEILQGIGGETKKTKKMTEELKTSVKAAKITSYGRERLPAGPAVDTSDDIIIVEGRADVLAMLEAGIENVISLKGAVIPRSVTALSKKKETTLFVDGDRGGDMAVRNFVEFGKIDYVAKAPDGKEVEELTQKEILKCLKNRLPYKAFALKSSVKTPLRGGRDGPPRPTRERTDSRRGSTDRPPRERTDSRRAPRRDDRGGDRRDDRRGARDDRRAPRRDDRRGGRRDERAPPRPAPKPPEELVKAYDAVRNSMKAVLLDKNNKVLGEVQVSEMISKIRTQKEVDKVIFDGIITQRLIDLAASKKVSTLVGLKKAKIDDTKGVAVFAMA